MLGGYANLALDHCPCPALSVSPPMVEQGVTGPRPVVRRWSPPYSALSWFHPMLMDVLIPLEGYVWFSWGGVQIHLTSYFTPQWASAWPSDAFSRKSLLFLTSPVSPQILMPLHKEPREFLRVPLLSPRAPENCM